MSNNKRNFTLKNVSYFDLPRKQKANEVAFPMPHRELVSIGLYSKWCSWRQSLEFNYQENNYCPSMTTRNHLTLCDSMGSPCLKHRCRLGNRCLTARVHWLCLSTTIINMFLNRSSQMVSSLCVCPPKKAIVLLLPLERCFSQPWMGASATPGNVTELWTEAHSVPVLYMFFLNCRNLDTRRTLGW